jgi:hypothetical protein
VGLFRLHHIRFSGGGAVKKGYGGIVVALWMLLTAWTFIAIVKLLF